MIDKKKNSSLCIHPDYDRREAPVHFDDRKMRDEWQNGVYKYARDLASKHGLTSIVDYGCGSGFKLMKFFSGLNTVGYELEPALSHLREVYPDRKWALSTRPVSFYGDMFICSDVIEHLAQPELLMQRIANSTLQFIVLSTPSLEILAERGDTPRFGPPNNESHVNEWTTREFESFVAMYLQVLDHVVIDSKQGTQLILAALR